jgi:uncharacterized protein YutE (UPF0331/DUF86 family)
MARPRLSGEVFDILCARGVIAEATAQTMRRGTRLRNLIAHAYADLDPELLFAAATAGLDQIEGFLAEIADWTAHRTGGS